MPGADGMNSKFMKNAFVGWTFTAGLYYPPDFDSTKLTPLKNLRPKGQQQAMNIRMMFPFTMICDSCGEYNYTGTKFTAKVETIKHESYLGLKVYRFYGRCRHCWAEFTFKTDPKNSDYTMESGGKRTYEAWKDADMMEAQLKAEKQKEAEEDHMKALEQKAVDVQAEMQRLEDLDAIRSMNKRLGTRDQTIEEALDFLFKKAEKDVEAEEALEDGELKELDGFRQAQEDRKRQQLDDAVEDGKDGLGSVASFGGSSASSSSGAAPDAGAKSGAGGAAAGAAIAAAVAERAEKQARARPKLSVKRKAATGDASPRGDGGGGTAAASSAAPGAAAAEGDAAADWKRTRTSGDGAAAGSASVVAAGSAAVASGSAGTETKQEAGAGSPGGDDAGGGMGLGLGAYDSDDSS